MTKFNAEQVLNAVTNIRANVLTSRSACTTAFACDLHGKLLEKLAEMEVALDLEIERARDWAAAATTSFDLDIIHFYNIRTSFEHDWINGPVSLLDPIHEFVTAEGEGETCRIGIPYTEASPTEFEGLDGIFETIAQQTGVRFVAARV